MVNTTVLLQVIIVEFGSYAFSTVSLTTDQWLWCLLFGCGELLWGQVSKTRITISLFNKKPK